MPSFVKDKVKLTTLQNFLDSIERAEKYFVEEAEKNIFDLRPNLSHPKSASISHIDCFIGGELNKSINKKSYLDPKQRQKRHAHWLINDKLEIKIIRF